MTKIVVAGAGFGGVKVFERLKRQFRRFPDVSLTLVNDVNYFLFTPLLHEVATGSLSPENIIVPLPPLAAGGQHRFLVGRVQTLDRSQRLLITDRGEVPYDYLVLALGAETNYYDLPGASEHTLPLKDLDDAARIKNRIIGQFDRASGLKTAEERRRALTFVIVGGGATGVELAGELADFCRHTFSRLYPPALVRLTRIIVIQKDDHILPQFSAGLRRRSLAVLGRKGVEALVNITVRRITDREVALATGEVIPAETVIWTAGVKARTISAEPPLSLHRGRLRVDSYLRTMEDDHIFVLGDLAAAVDPATGEVLPMLAQVADRQAKLMANNLAALVIKQGRLRPFRYRSQGSLVSLGGWFAAGEMLGFHFAGRLTWLLWRAVYFSKMPTINKKLQIALDWLINAFLPRDVSTLPFDNRNLHQ